jgi:hypothetical protein
MLALLVRLSLMHLQLSMFQRRPDHVLRTTDRARFPWAWSRRRLWMLALLVLLAPAQLQQPIFRRSLAHVVRIAAVAWCRAI